MITMTTDYSPEVAGEKQEADNIRMIQMLLVVAGLSTSELVYFNKASDKAAIAYVEALGEPDVKMDKGGMIHSQASWEAAKLAAEVHLDAAGDILKDAGITIENKLIKSPEGKIFSHIVTTVYNDFGNMEAMAQINRYVVDKEAETYKDNVSGYGKPLPQAA
ncbi:MAG: hypothetical protein DRQ62_14235 [Gammaproteobacteria bacterium]|nr:MAG: hypothetical protein DRQ62_14235 [Gammaproteobacteria bacterium]